MAFPPSNARRAYELLVAILKNDPVFGREIVTFQCWAGEEMIAPAEAMTPFLRLTPKNPDNGDWIDTETIRQNMDLDIWMVLNGNVVGDMIDAWDALLKALFPVDPTSYNMMQQRYYDAGISCIHPKQTSITVDQTSGGLTLSGKGVLSLELNTQVNDL